MADITDEELEQPSTPARRWAFQAGQALHERFAAKYPESAAHPDMVETMTRFLRARLYQTDSDGLPDIDKLHAAAAQHLGWVEPPPQSLTDTPFGPLGRVGTTMNEAASAIGSAVTGAAGAAEDWAKQNPELLRSAVSSSETGNMSGPAGTMAAALARKLGGMAANAALNAAPQSDEERNAVEDARPENMGYVGP